MKFHKYIYSFWALLILFSVFTIDRFPPVNFDEVGNVVLAHQMRTEGKINYPLMHDVIRPQFEDLSSSGNGSIRSIHVGILAILEIFLGENITTLRLFSVCLWILIGAFLYIILNTKISRPAALLGTTLWFLSIDGFIASHLIRPDIMMGVIIVFVLAIVFITSEVRGGTLILAGAGVGLAPGIHPHGLLLIPALLLYCLVKPKTTLRIGAGIIIGVLLWGLLCDFETYAFSKYSYVATLYKQTSLQYYDRLLPWNLLRDACLMIYRPESFYFPSHFKIPTLWNLSNGVTLVMTILSFLWIIYKKPKSSLLIFCGFGLVIMFLGIGYGHFRREIIYNIPITIFAIVLVSWSLTENINALK